jgi:hypothetical protein
MIPVTLRLATPRDDTALERLAGLDSRPPSPGPHLVAELDGRIDAAMSMRTGELVADPFRPTAAICEVLRCYAGAQRRREEPRRPALEPRPRLVTA